MAIAIAELTDEQVQTLKTNSEPLAEAMSDKLLYAGLISVFHEVVGDAGDVDVEQLKANAQKLCQQMSETELKAALLYSLAAATLAEAE